MVSRLPLVVERPRRFPPRVEAELARRRAHLLERASGRVLDLDRAAHRAEVARAAAGSREAQGTYDTAVSVAQLVRFPDLVAALRGIDRLLGPSGVLLAAEPVGRPGAISVLLDSLLARHPAVVGLHLGRDLTASVRATTLVLDDLVRFTMPTTVTPLRHAVEVAAVRIPAAEAESGAEAAEAVAR